MAAGLRSLALFALCFALVACTTTTSAVEPTPTLTLARLLHADTRVPATGGATFTAPKGWFVTARPDLVVLEDPGRTFTVTFVDVAAASGDDATAIAWRRARPDFARRILRATRPASDPWDELVRTEYQTTTAEARLVWANARRSGTTWYVMLFDGPRPEIDRRAAQINTVYGSVTAPGVQPESWSGRFARPLDAARIAQLDAFVEAALARATVPGAAIALVQGDRVVYERTFGVRDVATSEPVTPDTRFMIGSITKPLTSLMMAALVDRGRLRWETPVAELMPSFALGDAEATRRLTVKHTVCACTGLPRQDMEMFFGYSRATPESRLAEMKTMVPTTGFGETFQYSNPLVSAGGYIAARAFAPELPVGAAYDRAMQELVLDPLGMTHTTTDFGVAARGDHAKPHALTLAGPYTALGLDREGWLPAMRPAGGIWSTVRDMARYVRVELGRGVLDGRTIVSADNIAKRREAQVNISTFASYALALSIDRIRRVTVIGHGGATSGFSALLFFLPDHDVGGVVLTNAWGADAFTSAVRARVLELLFDGRERAARNLELAMTQREEFGVAERPKIETAPPRDVMARYVGTYDSDRLGRVVVRLEGERAIFDTGDWRSALGRKVEPDGTVKLVMLDPPWAYFELVTSEVNGRPQLTIERPQLRYVFEQRP